MKTRMLRGAPASAKTELLLLPVFEEASTDGIKTLLGPKADFLTAAAKEESFEGKSGQTFVQRSGGQTAAPRVMAVGMGKLETLDAAQLRRALVGAFKQARKLEVTSVAMAEPVLVGTKVSREQFGRILAETAGMVSYTINHFKTAKGGHKPEKRVAEVAVAGSASAELQKGLADGALIAQAVNDARDLTNLPAGMLTPTRFAEHAQAVAGASNGRLSCKLYHRAKLEKMGANAFLAVAQGSVEEPVLVEMTYDPAEADPGVVLGLVGKTITFDTGGNNLKTAEGMRTMKCDMAGGAAVVNAMRVIAGLGLPVKVKAVMAATENCCSGSAYKPGDVIRTMAGLTVEVDNTDAEGRLTLADAVEFIRRQGATHVIDLATLTGAVVVALGDKVAGAFTNNAEFMAEVSRAAATAGEHIHELPMYDFYADQNKSKVADLKNSGGRAAGSITAAWFIRKFAGDTPWVHLDIAGTAFRDKEFEADPDEGTGYGVRTLVELARSMAARRPEKQVASRRRKKK